MDWTHCPIKEVPAEVLAEKPPTPRKRTLATRKRDHQRHLLRWGCHLGARDPASVPRDLVSWPADRPSAPRQRRHADAPAAPTAAETGARAVRCKVNSGDARIQRTFWR